MLKLLCKCNIHLQNQNPKISVLPFITCGITNINCKQMQKANQIMKYLSSDNYIYKLSLACNILNPFLILSYLMSTLASFLYGAIQSSPQTVEKIIEPSPGKKKESCSL